MIESFCVLILVFCRMFYGPGGPYALFAGKDASQALAKMSFEEKDLTGDISGLGPFELDALQDWEYKFMSKYVKVGTVKKTVPVTEGSSGEAAETTARDVPNHGENGPSETAELRPRRRLLQARPRNNHNMSMANIGRESRYCVDV